LRRTGSRNRRIAFQAKKFRTRMLAGYRHAELFVQAAASLRHIAFGSAFGQTMAAQV
jgi:hypothetical protein